MDNNSKTHTEGWDSKQQKDQKGEKVHVEPAATVGLLIKIETKSYRISN